MKGQLPRFTKLDAWSLVQKFRVGAATSSNPILKKSGIRIRKATSLIFSTLANGAKTNMAQSGRTSEEWELISSLKDSKSFMRRAKLPDRGH